MSCCLDFKFRGGMIECVGIVLHSESAAAADINRSGVRGGARSARQNCPDQSTLQLLEVAAAAATPASPAAPDAAAAPPEGTGSGPTQSSDPPACLTTDPAGDAAASPARAPRAAAADCAAGRRLAAAKLARLLADSP